MIGWLAEHCKQHLLAEKWLLAPQLRIAGQWKDRVNLRGCNTIHLHSKTIATATISLVSNQLAEQQLHFAAQSTVQMMVRSVLVRLLDEGKLGYFQQVQSMDGLSNLIARSIRDLRLADVSPASVKENVFQSSAKGADLRLIYQAYCELLEQRRVVDYAACIRLVIDGIEDQSIQLPDGLIILVPETWRLAHTEQRLLRTLKSKSTLLHPDGVDPFSSETESYPDRLTNGDAEFEFFAGLGEVNEVRGVFCRILANAPVATKLDDVEILYTDYGQYVPLILEQLAGWLADVNNDTAIDLDALPVTFAEGIACIYSRPGRALRGWLRWIKHEFVQTRAVQLIREGLLVRPDHAETIGFSRLANTLRRMPIGFQCERYLAKIGETIRTAEQSLKEYQSKGYAESNGNGERPKRDFGLPALRAVLTMIDPLIRCAATDGDDASDVLEKAKRFLLDSARVESRLDRLARAKLLDDIDGMLATLKLTSNAELDVLQWLEELPLESHVLASGPQPGCVHVASLMNGGYAGRKQLFCIGLDDGRYPKRVSVDSVLLDTERRRLSKNLPTTEEVGEDVNRALDRALHRSLDAAGRQIALSYSVRNLADDRERYPSASMLELYRITTNNDQADMDDLLLHLSPPIAFVSLNHADQLSPTDFQMASLLTEQNLIERQKWLEKNFSHARYQRLAREMETGDQLSAYDGYIPRAGVDLDPSASEIVSASRLEMFGACPRRFMFRQGLRVRPPDEWAVDRERWLDPLQFGNLVHELFEQFMGKLTRQDLIPNVNRDRQPLLDLLSTKINALKADIPIPNEDAYRRTCDLLEETCEIFLDEEQQYCQKYHARPWVLEASLGLDVESKTELDCREPIELTLSDGRVIRVGGRLDRVDKLTISGSERYAIWDYKSGSSYGFDQEKPFNQGRKLQPYLYVGMLRHRISALGGGTDAVESFGYFFPSPKTDGQRMSWTRGSLRSGNDVLTNICDLICSGVFLPTTDKSDCTYCDYLSVCGDAEAVATQSLRKSSRPCNKLLAPWRRLREIELETEVS